MNLLRAVGAVSESWRFFKPGLLASVCAVLLNGRALCQAQNAPAASEANILIVALEGKVEISERDSTRWFLVQTGQKLKPFDKLRTGPNSRATLRWSDQSVVPVGALSEIEILEPHAPEALWGLKVIEGIISFFHRDKPGRIKVITSGAVAGVRGTEFVLSVVKTNGVEVTTISVIDGEVEFGNDQGSPLTLSSMEQAIAEPGKAPMRTSGFNTRNIMQWCFYYPGVIDLDDLPFAQEETQRLSESLAAYRAGDLLSALSKYTAPSRTLSGAEQLYHAALLLSVGQVEQTEQILGTLTATAPSENLSRLANALEQLIAAVKRQPNPSVLGPELPSEFLAASYYAQSQALGDPSLKSALQLARQAADKSPRFGFAWERVAELEFSFGHTTKALEALNRSLNLAPANAQALALRGFLLTAQNKPREALYSFDQAIATDPALGNAWLGRGLCKIRLGWGQTGLKSVLHSANYIPQSAMHDLLVAAAIEPQRALLRSYLGKSYANEGNSKKAAHELDLAKSLDPNDPTAWLYSALLNQQDNRINAGIHDLEQSQELNDNRQLYRSRMLLDEDRAVRSASLAAVYRDDGMTEVSLREAARAVTADYANYSSHLFLANSFDALRDPTRFNLRYETPWFNELLLANLLAPVGVPAISPNISQQEYSRMFESDRLGLTTTTDARSDGQYREVASQFGSYRSLSYSLDLDWQRNEGVRPNNDLTRIEWYSQVKFQLTPQDSFLVLTKYQDYHSGDNFQYFDPTRVSVSTNGITGIVTTNTAYSPSYKFDEFQKPIALGAYHREWAPGIHTLALGGRLVNDQHISDKEVPLYVFNQMTNGALQRVSRSDFDIAYRSEFEIWIAELNQIFKTDRNTLILGGRFQTGEFDTSNALTNTTIFGAFFPPVREQVQEDMQRWSIYGYDTWEAWPDHLWLTAGLSYDQVHYPENFRQAPISAGETSTDLLGPKAALVWSLSSMATLRGAYSRSLGGVSLDESYRLEPAQLAGFNQSYRTLISESIVGSVSAPKFETAGGALDLKLSPTTYVGLLGEVLNSQVNRVIGVYRLPDDTVFALPSSTPQHLDYHEYSAALTVNQLLAEDWALGASYRFVRSELEQKLPEVSLSDLPGSDRLDSSDLHIWSVYLQYNHRSGFFARTDAEWYLQQNFTRSANSASGAADVKLPGDQFWQLNFWVGYRFRRNFGDISLGLLNATDTDYRLAPLNPYSELPRERVVAARVRFRF
jgi:tetratricopeptide (TPR) repeat protein